ncbi:hypothetical protein, partial [Peribacillus simplex]|uniref:hypothetical protein n=1 Tax=Peribacillus simplex TaxID=1478 RepID=UPI0019D622E4
EYLPVNHQGNVLITSRSEGRLNSIIVRELSLRESTLFLLKSTDQEDIETAEDLSKELGNLPLALEQASAYIQQTGLTLLEYLKRFRSHKMEIIGRGEALNYNETVLTTWSISLQEVRKKLNICREFMLFCSFLSPSMISKTMLIHNGEFNPKFLREHLTNVFELDDIFVELRNYSLIQMDNGTFSVHPLLQTVIIGELNQDEKIFWVEQVLEVLENHSKHIGQEQGIEVVVSHLMRILEHSEEVSYVSSSVVYVSSLLTKLYLEFGNYNKALQFAEKSVEHCERIVPYSELLASSSYHNLGIV